MIDLSLLAKSTPPQTIREHSDDAKGNAQLLGIIYHLDIVVLNGLILACEYHDYGKVNIRFQGRIHSHSKFSLDNEIPHNLLSVYFIDREQFENEEVYLAVCYAVLYHHSFYGKDSCARIVKEKKELIELLLEGHEHFTIKNRLWNKIEDVRNEVLTIKIKGLLHRCDYAASAGIPVEYPNNFLESALEELLHRWKMENPDMHWNELQEFCKSHKDDNMIITAPTGMGKTEASLHWMGNHKGFYVLPLLSAINCIYERIRVDLLRKENIEERLALLHSDNVGYLMRNAGDAYDIEDFKEYQTKVKTLSFPLTVTTPDQIFDFVFKTNNYEMKLVTASYAKVVIDEIQAYDASMLAYLITGLHRIMGMGGKVAIFTATLPPFVRDLLLGTKKEKFEFTQKDYSHNSVRHNVKILQKSMGIEEIVSLNQKNMEKHRSNKILVICNTVKKAQEIYDELVQKNLVDTEVKLLHAKYIKKDRNRLEHEILVDGKTFQEDGVTLNGKNVIWVATSVVEASLDIDFDYLFTELSELSGLFQRFGRCNRKGRKDCKEPNCFVYTEIDEKLLNRGKGKGFIDERLYELSKRALCSVDGLLTESDKLNLINESMTTDNMKDSPFMKMYRATVRDLDCDVNEYNDEVKKRFRNIISCPVIPWSVYDNHLEEFLELEAELECKDTTWEQRLCCKEKIMEYVVNVGAFDIGAYNYQIKNMLIKKTIKISRYEEVFVVQCHYDAKKGFSRLSKGEIEEIKGGYCPYDNDFGVFM